MVDELSQEGKVSFRLVVFAEPDDVHALRDLLVEHLGLHPSDAQIHSQSVPGVLPDSLNPMQADILKNRIHELGINAQVILQQDVPDFTHTAVVHHARCIEQGLETLGHHGEQESLIPWSEIELINVGQVPLESSLPYSTGVNSVLVTSSRPRIGTAQIKESKGLEAWVVRNSPLEAIRVEHNQMNYEYLADRKTESSTENFRLFLEDILSFGQAVYQTPSARAFLQRSTLNQYEFASSKNLQQNTTYHLLLKQRINSAAAPE